MTHPHGALVVGLGAPDRGDDALGPTVAARVAATAAERGLRCTRVVEHEDPTSLLDLLEAGIEDGPHTLVVVDAVRSARAPGTVLVLEVGDTGQDRAALADRVDPGPAGTHGFGLAGAIELARVLGRLPPRVVVVGVEAQQFDHGAPMSEEIAAALPAAVAAVLDALGTDGLCADGLSPAEVRGTAG